MTEINYDYVLSIMEKEMRSASKIFFEEEPHKNFKMKGKNDYVTVVDFKVQEYLKEKLLKLIDTSTLLAEEDGFDKTDFSKYTWILDPVDGTTNLFHGLNHSVISLALMEDKKIVIGAIYDPFTDEFFKAIKNKGAYLNEKKITVSDVDDFNKALIGVGTGGSRLNRTDETFDMLRFIFENTAGVRRIGSAALEIVYVACGRYDGFIEDGLNLWDYAAAKLIAEEAGGVVFDMHGEEINTQRKGGIICGNKVVTDELRRFIY